MAAAASRNPVAARWSGLSPDAKRKYVIIGVIVAFLAVAIPLVSEPPKPKGSNTTGNVRKEALGGLLTDTDPRKLGLSGVSEEVGELRTLLAQTRSELDSMRKAQDNAGANPDVDVLRAEINTLKDELARTQQPPTTPLPPAAPAGTVWNPERPAGADISPPNTGVVPPVTPPGGNPRADRPPPPIAIRTITQASEKPAGAGPAVATTAVEAKKEQGAYLPSGTIIQGVMLNGLDAPTGRGATGDPIPVLVRIKHEAWMPNRFRMDVRDCHMIAAGFGDLPSERAYLRSETISCIRSDGGVIDIPIEMYAVGDDGKAGIRGTVVSKQGAVLAKALMAGFAEGVSNAFQPQYGFANSGGGISGQNLESGVYGGASSALDRISAYYLKLADSMHPIVEVSGGRAVNFITLRGTTLQLAKN